MKDIAKSLFLEVISEMVQEMCAGLMSDADLYLRAVQGLAWEILNETIDPLAK